VRSGQSESSDIEPIIYVDRVLWLRLAEADSPEQFAKAWLTLQCSMLSGITSAVVVLGEPDIGPFLPVAMWPDGARPDAELIAAVELALAQRQSRVVSPVESEDGKTGIVSYPIIVDGRVYGVVGVAIQPNGQFDSQVIVRQVQWGSAWLDAFVRRRHAFEAEGSGDRMMVVLDVVATLLQFDRFTDACAALANEIAAQLECDRVALGFLKHGDCSVEAISNTIGLSGDTNLVHAIEFAMDEALDQNETIRYPLMPDDEMLLAQKHAELAQSFGGGAILTVPLFSHDEICGAMTLERPESAGFDVPTTNLVRSMAAAAGPMLMMKRQMDRSLPAVVRDSAQQQLGRVVGPEYLGRKIVLAAIIFLVAFFTVATGDYKVTASSRVEGAVRRIVTAPIDGFIVEASVRAGDTVDEGSLLAALDDHELRLQRLQVSSERAQFMALEQEALANRNRAEMQVFRAQVAQQDARLAFLDEEIARTRIVAPFQGLIVRGDLSQSLGSAVRRGTTLFELTPLNSYRVILQADEKDIDRISPGQKGTLILSSLISEVMPITITRVTPVAGSEEGLNFFRVEAQLDEASDRLRPGMEGISKITVGEQRLIWIWTHNLTDWLRLWIWKWWP
jgi:RND family efflux transporter MFP subunit